ncbi:hypothetical protein HPP92_000315 [Vanilla planifolia]|uniref:Uncharacterized protein n=1 Tax=Vanilla planifolia TaxID=51239 RepID=A0A835VCH4_VANPL|nr:hypothetical protein HPP92_000315 [Vanilla planifolia]
MVEANIEAVSRGKMMAQRLSHPLRHSYGPLTGFGGNKQSLGRMRCSAGNPTTQPFDSRKASSSNWLISSAQYDAISSI